MISTRVCEMVAIAYLLGSIPTGYWLGKLSKGIDVRQHGSGNLGATNVFRVLGPIPGTMTLILDIVKGAAPVLFVQRAYPGDVGLSVAAGAAAIVGHTTSVFVGFRGGKGVATSAGVFAALLPLPSAIAVGVFLICLAITRMVSASSIAASVALPAAAFWLAPNRMLAITAMVAGCLVIWRHRGNIRRILDGSESRVGTRGPA